MNADLERIVQRFDDAWAEVAALAVGSGDRAALGRARAERSEARAALLDVLAVRDQQLEDARKVIALVSVQVHDHLSGYQGHLGCSSCSRLVDVCDSFLAGLDVQEAGQ